MQLSAFHITLCFNSQDDRLHGSVTGRREQEGGSDAPNEERREVTGGEEGGRRDKESKGEEKG